MSKSFGTGFFVGTDGMIATNAHVISSTIEDKEVKKSVGDIFNAMKKYLEFEYDEKYERLEKVVIHDKDFDHDLALIQLKNKHTPEDRYVLVVAEEDPFETYSRSCQIYLYD